MKFVSLFVIFLVALLATTTLSAQENRAVALYAIGAGGLNVGSAGDMIGGGSNLGSQVGVGVDFNPEGFGLGLRFTNGSPVSQSYGRRMDNLPPWFEGPTPTINESTRTRNQVFTAMLQKGFGNEKARFVIGAGPGMVLSNISMTQDSSAIPAQFGGGGIHSSSIRNNQFVGAFGGTLVVRAGNNFDFRLGFQYLKGFTGNRQSYLMPLGGGGIGF